MDYEENMAVAAGHEFASWVQQRPDNYALSWNLKPTQHLPVTLTDHKSGEK